MLELINTWEKGLVHAACPIVIPFKRADITQSFAAVETEQLAPAVHGRDVRFGRAATVSFESLRSEFGQNSARNYLNSALPDAD